MSHMTVINMHVTGRTRKCDEQLEHIGILEEISETPNAKASIKIVLSYDLTFELSTQTRPGNIGSMADLGAILFLHTFTTMSQNLPR